MSGDVGQRLGTTHPSMRRLLDLAIRICVARPISGSASAKARVAPRASTQPISTVLIASRGFTARGTR